MTIKLRLQSPSPLDTITAPVVSGTFIAPVFDKGQLLTYQNGIVGKIGTATENLIFLGVSDDLRVSTTDIMPVAVIQKGIFSATVGSAAYTFGQPLAYVGGATDNLASSTANTIAWSAEDTGGASVTTLKVLIDVKALGKLYAVK